MIFKIMGTYKRLKDAREDVKYWENELECHKDNKGSRGVIKANLKSAKKYYNAARFTHNVTIGAMIIAIVVIMWGILMYLKTGGYFG